MAPIGYYGVKLLLDGRVFHGGEVKACRRVKYVPSIELFHRQVHGKDYKGLGIFEKARRDFACKVSNCSVNEDCRVHSVSLYCGWYLAAR